MLKYSLAKLCGTPVQYENKGKRSYEKSIERTIELIGSYLKNENCREICLEDAKITNKFIAKRMETDLNIQSCFRCIFYKPVPLLPVQ